MTDSMNGGNFKSIRGGGGKKKINMGATAITPRGQAPMIIEQRPQGGLMRPAKLQMGT